MLVPGALNAGLFRRSFNATTLDPAVIGASVVLSGGNRTYGPNPNHNNPNARSVFAGASNKYYWEMRAVTYSNGGNSVWVGICNPTFSIPSSVTLGSDGGGNSWAYTLGTGDSFIGNSSAPYGVVVNQGDVMDFALDLVNGKFFVGINGTWQNSGDPVAGTNPLVSGLSGSIFAAISSNQDAAVFTFNFGQTAFSNPVPTGYKPGLGS